jgi:lysine 6-dehydrogenase
VNILAEAAIRKLDSVDSCRLFVGGLPQKPEPPLNYQLVYSLEGVLDYYTTESFVLENGRPASAPRSPSSSRSTSRAPLGPPRGVPHGRRPLDHELQVRGEDRPDGGKTLRHPATRKILRSLRDLGFFSSEEVDAKGTREAARPRDLGAAPQARQAPCRDSVVAARRLREAGRRAGALRLRAGRRLRRRGNGISAMMRTTGYSLTVTAQMQVRRRSLRPSV